MGNVNGKKEPEVEEIRKEFIDLINSIEDKNTLEYYFTYAKLTLMAWGGKNGKQ